MKKLRQFQEFNTEAFFKDKDVRVLADEPWNEYEDGEITRQLGTKYKCVIAVDKTVYEGDDVMPDLNAGNQIDIKVPQQPKEYKKFNRVQLVNPKATVYGTFMSELSVKADDIDIKETNK